MKRATHGEDLLKHTASCWGREEGGIHTRNNTDLCEVYSCGCMQGVYRYGGDVRAEMSGVLSWGPGRTIRRCWVGVFYGHSNISSSRVGGGMYHGAPPCSRCGPKTMTYNNLHYYMS